MTNLWEKARAGRVKALKVRAEKVYMMSMNAERPAHTEADIAMPAYLARRAEALRNEAAIC